MNCVIPFTKDIKFDTNIGEIISVSLENEYTANNSEILGNFIISGEYKAHEVSVNKENFEYVLPFSVNLTTRIDTDSVDFAVEDFTYEVIDNDTLRVNVEYSINALELVSEEKEDTSLEEILDNIDSSFTRVDEVLEEQKEDVEEKTEVIEEPKIEEKIEEPKEELEDRTTSEEAKETILDAVEDKENIYVTYRIHIVSETDTIEAICTKYSVSENVLGSYNDLSTLSLGDKIIIPDLDE